MPSVAARRAASLLLGLALVGLPRAGLANDNAAALWLVNEIVAPLGDRLSLHAMLQNRWTQDIGSYERTVVRPWVEVAWPDHFQLAAGYDLHAFESPVPRREHRSWQRVAVSHPVSRVKLLGHFWLEQRFFEGADDIALRGRFNAGGQIELTPGLSLLVRNEWMFNLNRTSRIDEVGLGENHFVVALFKDLPAGLRVQVGYLQQYLNQPGDVDLLNHTVTTGFIWRTPALASWF